MAAAVPVLGVLTGLAGTGVSVFGTIQANKAAKQQADIQKKEARRQQVQQVRKEIRTAQAERARIAQAGVGRGAGDSSPVQIGQAAATGNAGENINNITASTQNTLNFISAQERERRGNTIASIGGAIGSVFA